MRTTFDDSMARAPGIAAGGAHDFRFGRECVHATFHVPPDDRPGWTYRRQRYVCSLAGFSLRFAHAGKEPGIYGCGDRFLIAIRARLSGSVKWIAKDPDNLWGASYLNFRDWQARSHAFEQLGAILFDDRILREGTQATRVGGLSSDCLDS
jgi:hypothetical protein